jgi:hypothetical protein
MQILDYFAGLRVQLFQVDMVLFYVARLCSVLPLSVLASPFTWLDFHRI